MSDVGIGLVGIGGYGECYARELLKNAARHGVRFAAAVDPAPERSALKSAIEAAGVPLFRGLAEMYARLTPDLLVLASPIPRHAPQALAALAKGSNVLCEKPVAATVQDALAMRDAERRAGGPFLAVGFQWSAAEAVHALKSDIRRGLLGRPLRLKTMVQWPRDSAYYGRNGWAGRIRDDQGAWVLDSPLSNATGHYLHNMLYVLGREEHLSATLRSVESELYRANPIENFDTAALRMITDADVEILFLTTHACRNTLGPVSVFEFESAVVTYSEWPDGAFEARFTDGRVKNYGNPDAQPHRKLWLCVDAVREGKPVPCGVQAVLPHLICFNAVQEAPGAIVGLPASAIGQRVAGDGVTLRWIDGVEDLFAACFERGLLTHELGQAPWAVAGRRVSVAGYRRFPSVTSQDGLS